ncbi:hypothetical protein [Massilia sp.]|uniref:hypothetical protein n=1 Tax=Massilia sp. TaxID=1882437 RepID=UPI0028ADC6D6|nr:hypothetical protein [Massilia sp.]
MRFGERFRSASGTLPERFRSACSSPIFDADGDTRAAPARARAAAPALCLLDIGLPDMDGKELAQRLRADPATAGATLVASAGYG